MKMYGSMKLLTILPVLTIYDEPLHVPGPHVPGARLQELQPAPRRFAKRILQQRLLLGGGRSVSQSDGDVDGGAHSALTAAVLKVGMPPCPHRKVQRDASAKRPRSRVQRASEAPDGDTTTSPGTMLVAFARKARLIAIAPPSSTNGILGCRRAPRPLELQNLMEDPVWVNGCESILCFDPARL